MIFEIVQILIWITTIMLTISGLDDLYVDLMYWVLRHKHKSKLPDFSEMYDKEEKPIAIILGAWNESGVIGRTLSFAVRNLRYKNYRLFVGVYPNDQKTIDVVSKISQSDRRVKMVVNPQPGPSTKADNLNCIYAAICDFEKQFGEFEILLVHDAEDFIHPRSLKLYNFLIGYKGYHGIQIPVVPIKSNLGNMIHRTYCDAFAETHTKDMIIRQEMKTFLPFSGTGMGFHRKSMYCIEKYNFEHLPALETAASAERHVYLDPFGRTVEINQKYFNNDEVKEPLPEYFNNTSYKENPFESLKHKPSMFTRTNKRAIISYTAAFLLAIFSCAGLFVYAGSSLPLSPTFNDSVKSTEDKIIDETNQEYISNMLNANDTSVVSDKKSENTVNKNALNTKNTENMPDTENTPNTKSKNTISHNRLQSKTYQSGNKHFIGDKKQLFKY
ncbi:MAG: glycosyltransferase [Ignavibacteria bacterium]|nr:glycosyltransferase [Ignavibacteria bacterium]